MSHDHHQTRQVSHRSRSAPKTYGPASMGWVAAALIAVVAFFGSVPAHAQIGASLVTSIADDADLSSYSFPSATYSNNVLYIAFTTSMCASGVNCGQGVDVAPTVTSVTGAGLSFTEIGPAGGVTFSTLARRIQAWRALATTGAGTGAVTVSLNGTASSMGAAMIAFTGMKTSGTNGADAVVQWPTNTGGGSVYSLAVTMAAFANSNNRPVAFFAHRAEEPTYPKTGYTELFDGTTNSLLMGYEAEWHATTAETNPSASWATSSNCGGFALEIAADTGAAVPLEQEGFRFRADDGSESAATWLALQDANIVRDRNLNTRVRAIVDSTGDPAPKHYQLEYRLSGGTFAKVVPIPSAGAVSYVNSGGRVSSAGATSANPALPGGLANGNIVFAVVGSKNNETHSSATAEWTKLDQRNSGTLWTVSLWYHIVDGTDTAITVTWTTSVANFAQCWQMSGVDAASPIGATSFNTGTASPHTVTGFNTTKPGSRVIYVGAGTANTAYGTQAGWTENLDNGSATGVTRNVVGGRDFNDAGSATGNLSITGAAAAWVLWLLELTPAAPPIGLSPSGFINDAGEATTAQLIPPTGKAGNFTAGKINDVLNPAQPIDIVNNNYTELEWCLKATDLALWGGVYEFRVTANGLPLTTYTVLPQWTIGAAPTTNYRSIGTNAGTLYSTGNASINIGTTAVTFGGGASLPVPAAVGAVGQGDRLIIGSETFYILSRVDDTHVTVQTAAAATHTSEAYTITRAYNDIQSWETGQQGTGNLVGENRIEVGVSYKDGVFTPAATITIDGYTTDASHYVRLTVAAGQRHNGTAGTGVIVDGGGLDSGDTHLFLVRDKYFRMEWLEIRNYFYSATAPGQPFNLSQNNAGDNLFSHMIIHNYSSTDAALAVRGAFNVYESVTIRNSIVYNGDMGIRTYTNTSLTLTLQNVTIYNAGVGLNHTAGNLIINNTIAVGNSTRDLDLDNGQPIDPGSGYNMYSTSAGGIPPGTNNQTPAPANLDDLFVSIVSGSENLHLESSGHNALNNGLDLSASFTDDIDAETRPTGANTWDIGADEVGAGDTSPPTPNPMTFASAPANASPTQIDLTSTTGSDDTPPVTYLFTNDNSSCGANAGTGGTSSSWQSGTSYSDSGLQANKCYGYTVTARDSVSPTPNTGTASGISSTYTSANTPGMPTLNGATPTTLNLTNAENGNPSSNPTTYFAVQVVTTNPNDSTWLNKWVNASGIPSATEVWLTDTQLDALALHGLTPSTTYGVKVKARNQDGDETPLSAEGQGTTTACPAPETITFDAASEGNTGSTAVGSLTVPHTVGAIGTNRILVVGVNIFSFLDPVPTVSTMTYAGQSMTFLATAIDPGIPARIRSEMWYITAPATGTNNIVITFSANVVAVAGGMSYTGVHQTTPFGIAAAVGGNGTAPSVIVSSAAGELVVDTVGSRQSAAGGQTLTAAVGQQERYNDVTAPAGDSNVVGAGSEKAGAASVTMSWTVGPAGARWAIVAAPLKPACGGGLFAYRRQITIGDATTPASCTTDLSDFPVLVKVTDASLMSAANGGHVESASGYDIIFRALDGTTQLDHEIEKYVATTGELVAWVRIPRLVYNADTTIYMYYGNWAVTTPTANPTGVWSNGYAAVWHLKEDPGPGGAGDIKDSTAYLNHGTPEASMISGDQVAGQLDGSLHFDGVDDSVNTGSAASLDNHTPMTMEAWINPNTWGEDPTYGYGRVLEKGTRKIFLVSTEDGFVNTMKFAHQFSGNDGTWFATTNALSLDSWAHVAVTYDSSSIANVPTFYVNGQPLTTTVDPDIPGGPTGTADPDATYDLIIGNTSAGDRTFNGIIDEARYSSVARDACWIGTEYNNQSIPTDVNLGGEQVVDSTYTYHQAITVANAMTPGSCTSNLANFPVLIDTTSWPTANKNTLKTVTNGGHVQSPTYYDLVFRDTSGLQLDHEIESYNATNGTLVAWVRIPSLNPSGDTTIYMYYGNSAITSPTANPTGVWNTSYGWRGVWHLRESPSGTSGEIKDSTFNANNGTTSGTMDSSDQVPGKVDGSLDFDGVDDLVDFGNPGSLQLTGAMTASAWVWVDAFGTFPAVNTRFVTKSGDEPQRGWELNLENSDSKAYFIISEDGYSATQSRVTSTGNVPTGQWIQYVGVFEPSTAVRIYVNGSLDNSNTTSIPSSQHNATNNVHMAERTLCSNCYLDGKLDEVRISSVARNTCWIGTEYNNQSSPGTTVTPGVEQVDPSTYDYHQALTIANAMTPDAPTCTGNLSSFPVLIDTTNWAAAYKDPLKTAPTGHVQSALGYDIIFRDTSDLQLDHEIEKYDGATGTLVAWVRVPMLAYNADTTIFMYYGNSLITTPTANPTGVWNTANGWRGVWHLKENPAGTAPQMMDSTSNANNGTSVGTMTAGDQVSAKINGGLDLEGTDDYIDAVNNGSTLNVGQVFSLSMWIKRNTTGSVERDLLTKVNAGYYSFKLNLTSANSLQLWVNGTNSVTGGTIADTGWHHVGGYSDGTNLKVFRDGVVDAGTGTTPAITYDSSNLLMGVGIWNSVLSGYLDGIIDEVRVSSVVRDSCWLGTEYSNQSTPDTYVTPGGEGTEPAVYTSQRTITIRDVMTPASCGANLSSFPILIDTTNWAAADKEGLKTVANGGQVESSNGYDIIFRDANDLKLDHEIEKYDGATGTLVAWVRIPTLAYNANTTITMHYGNSGITAPTQNAPGVWSNGFREVWHLHETSGGTVADSTASAYTGTASAGVNQNATTEKIDGADEFNGTTGALTLSDGTLTANSPFTIDAWFRLRNLPVAGAYAGIVTKNRNQTEPIDDWVGIYAVDGSPTVLTLGWGWDESQGGNLSGTTPLAAGQWYYGAMTYDGSNRTLYLNTNLENSSTGAFYNDNLGMATRAGNDGVDPAWFDGFIDEVRISSVARDACWIGTSYNTVQYAGDANYILPGSEIGLKPTAVEMVSLDAVHYPGRGVLISWQTGFEVDNLGFHVYRESAGERVRVTPSLIAGSALLAGAGTPLTAGQSYSWWDASPAPGATYWLEEWELSGERRWHGPVSVQPGAWQAQAQALSHPASGGSAQGSSPLLAGLGQAASGSVEHRVRRKLRQGVSTSDERLAVQWGLASRPAVKLLVSEDGWYRVSQEELLAAGLDPAVDPGSLQLFMDGRQVPILVDVRQQGVFASGDGIEFYGEGLETCASGVRVYWLVAGSGAGLRIPEVGSAGGWSEGPASFPSEVERADRTLYFPAFLNGEESNFFGAVVTATPVNQTVRVPHVDQSLPGELIVRLVGATVATHRVDVELNEVRVGTVVWEGMTVGELAVPVAGSMIVEGDNAVTLTAEGGEGDVSAVESIRVRYAHTWQADAEVLEFTLGGYQEVGIGGFRSSEIKVLDITDPWAVQALSAEVVEEGGSYTVTVGVPEAGERTLLAVGTGAIRHPVGVLPNRPTAWHAAGDGADLLIIGHRSLLPALEPLRALRESQGLKVAVVDVESVFDEFSYGARDPQAIKDFLACATKYWLRPPRYLLLVGDASSDPRNYLGFGWADLVPTKLVDTTNLETASDDWFADFDGDGIGDIPVGRIPAQIASEATTAIGKIVAYDGSARFGRVLLLADANDEENDFEALSAQVKAAVPSTVWVSEIFRGQVGDAAAKSELASHLNLGQTLINYIGHGSVAVWHGNWLTTDEAHALRNYWYPFVVSMTCLNGFFHEAQQESLAEALVEGPGGAVAVWASSGLTESASQVAIDEALVRLLFSGTTTLGDATRAAKAATSDMDVRRTWILFGDPTTRLRR